MLSDIKKVITPEFFALQDLEQRKQVTPDIKFIPSNNDERAGQATVVLNDSRVELTVDTTIKMVQSEDLFKPIKFDIKPEYQHFTIILENIINQFRVKNKQIVDITSNQIYKLQHIFKFQVLRPGACPFPAMIYCLQQIINNGRVICNLENPDEGFEQLFEQDDSQLTVQYFGELDMKTFSNPSAVEAKLMQNTRIIVKKGDFVIVQL